MTGKVIIVGRADAYIQRCVPGSREIVGMGVARQDPGFKSQRYQQPGQFELIGSTHRGNIQQVYLSTAPIRFPRLFRLPGLRWRETILIRDESAQNTMVNGVIRGSHDLGLEAFAMNRNNFSADLLFEPLRNPVNIVADNARSTTVDDNNGAWLEFGIGTDNCRP